MLFVDPEKLAELERAARECLLDVREASGLRVIASPRPETNIEAMMLTFLSALCGLHPIMAGGTQFVVNFGKEGEQFFPSKPVQFKHRD